MTTDEGRELLCNIQGPIAARLIAISLARFAAGGSTNHINFSAIFSPDLPFLSTACRKWPGHRHPPVHSIGQWVAGNGGLHDTRPWIRPALENRVQNSYDCIGRYR